MNTERRWQTNLAGRVLLNAFVGALLTAFVAALCGGAAGLMADWLWKQAGVALKAPPTIGISPYLMTGTLFGIATWAGLLVGAIIFGIATVRTEPGRTFEPLRALIGRVAVGQVLATAGACSAFLAFEAIKAASLGPSFVVAASMNFVLLMIGVPALIICGDIAGALSKRA